MMVNNCVQPVVFRVILKYGCLYLLAVSNVLNISLYIVIPMDYFLFPKKHPPLIFGEDTKQNNSQRFMCLIT